MVLRAFTICVLLGVFGCVKEPPPKPSEINNTVVVREEISELEKEKVPGTQNDVWVEPMPGYVRVPAQLDPRGIYYRPSHNTLIETRPGKVQEVQYPNEHGEYPAVSNSSE